MPPERLRRGAHLLLDNAPPLLEFSKTVLELAPVPAIPLIADGLLAIVNRLNDVRTNDEARKSLFEKAQSLDVLVEDMVREAAAGVGGSEDWTLPQQLEDLAKAISDLKKNADKLKGGGGRGDRVKELFYVKHNERILEEMHKTMDTALAMFKIRGQVSTAITVQNIDNNVRSAEEQRILATIPHVSAGYRCVEETKSGLMDGTRVELTQELWTWATTGFPAKDSRPIYYLSGAAGLGKSAFAYHLCRLMDEEWGLNLGASFFFSRGRGGLESARSFFPTVAHSFAVSQHNLRPHIINAAQTYFMNGEEQQMQEAFHRLLRMPLVQSSGYPIYQPTTFLIIDGLDECKDRELVPDLLRFVIDLVRHLPWLRVFIAARPEINILPILTSADAASIVHHRSLNDTIDDWQDDVALYMRTVVPKIGQCSDYLHHHPEDLEALIQRANGVFIYASIAVKFIGTIDDDPAEQFKLLLSQTGGAGLSSLDDLYLHILRSAFPPLNLKRTPERHGRVRALLTFLALRIKDLPPQSIAFLHGIPEDITLRMIDRLRSVLLLNANGEVVPLHATFVEFLLDSSRCIDTLYFVNTAQGHAQLASRCFSLLTFAPVTDYLRRYVDTDTPYPAGDAVWYSHNWWAHLHGAEQQEGLKEHIRSWTYGVGAIYIRLAGRISAVEANAVLWYCKPVDGAGFLSGEVMQFGVFAELWWSRRHQVYDHDHNIVIGAEDVTRAIEEFGLQSKEYACVVSDSIVSRFRERMLELERMIHDEQVEELWYNLDISKSYRGGTRYCF